MKIKNTKAGALTHDEVRALLSYRDCQYEHLWDDLDLQGLLDVYHANVIFDGVAAAFTEDGPDARHEERAIRAAMARSRRRTTKRGH